MKQFRQGSRRGAGATLAQVSFSHDGDFGAVGEWEYRGMPVFGPRGVEYRPCEGDRMLAIPAEGAMTCAGVLGAARDLGAGELRLFSAGGACILLKNNGDVVINGVVITREGKLLPAPGGGEEED